MNDANIIDDITEKPSMGKRALATMTTFAKDNPVACVGVIVLVCILLCIGFYIIWGKNKKTKTGPKVSEYDSIIDEIHDMQK